MLPYIFIWLALVSGVTLFYFLTRRVIVLKRSSHNFHADEPSLHVFVKPTIDYSAFRLVTLVKHLLRRFSLHALTLMARGLSLLKYFVVRLEQKFAKIIKSVRGQGPMGKRGAVSLFLQEMGELK